MLSIHCEQVKHNKNGERERNNAACDGYKCNLIFIQDNGRMDRLKMKRVLRVTIQLSVFFKQRHDIFILFEYKCL